MRASLAARLSGVALAFAALLSTAAAQDLSDLDRVGTELLRFQKPGALYAYLRDYQPDLFRVADASGLAEALDGKVAAADFKAKLDAAVKDHADLADPAAKLEAMIASHPVASGSIVGLSAEQIRGKSAADLVPELRTGLYQADQHWISKTWSADKRGSVPVRALPGKLLWFNPNVSIPELGIKAGVPLTEPQKEAVASLFSFETVPNTPDQATGTAAFPAHVGRAVNPNSNVVTILNNHGEVISDLVVKGAGPNVPNSTRDGRLDRSEAFLDSEVARNLYEAGIKNYDSLAVIEPDGLKGKAILVRAPRSMLRHLDVSLEDSQLRKGLKSLSDEELRATLEHLANEAAIREGKDHLSVSEWLGQEMPRLSGENIGRLVGLGVEHGSLSTRDNHGLGETVDWGMVKLRAPGVLDQVAEVWKQVKTTIERVNQILPDAEKVVVDEAKKLFDEAVAFGQKAVEGRSVRIDRSLLPEMSDSDVRTLARKTVDPSNPNAGTLSYSGSRDEAVARLEASGHVRDPLPSFDVLAKASPMVLQELADRAGIPLPANGTKAQMIAALTGRTVPDVQTEIGRVAQQHAADPKPEDGFTRRLGDLAAERDVAKVDAARDGR